MPARLENTNIGLVIRLAILVGLLVYMSSTTAYLIKMLPLGAAPSHLMASYARPFVIAGIVMIGLLWRIRSREPIRLGNVTIALLMLPALMFIIGDMLHLSGDVSIGQSIKLLFYNKAFSTYLDMTLLIVAITMLVQHDRSDIIIRVGGWVLGIIAALSVLLWILVRSEILSINDHFITNNNFQAYESSVMLIAVLVFRRVRLQPLVHGSVIILAAIIPVLHNSRGAMLLGAYLCAAILVDAWNRGSYSESMRRLRIVGASVSLLILSFGLVGIGNILSSESAQDRAERVISEQRYKERSAISYLTNIARSDKSELHYNYLSNNEVSSNDDVVSAFSRVGTTLLAIKIFLKNPCQGIGIWNAYNVEVAGFGIHGLIPLMLAGYGIWGLIPILAILAAAAVSCLRAGRLDILVHFSVATVVLGMLFNQYAWWMALVLPLVALLESERAA